MLPRPLWPLLVALLCSLSASLALAAKRRPAVGEKAAAPAEQAGQETGTAPMTVTVLYFDNRTGQPEYDVLQKGLADMLVSDLAALPSLQVVERERLEAVLRELKLQRGKAFDPATAQRLGKLVGASHAIAGSITAIAPVVRLDIRLFSVSTGKVLVTGSVAGKPEDLFGLEQELVRRFAAALAQKAPQGAPESLASGRTSVAGLLQYSQGLELADQGDLKGAQSKLVGAMKLSPEFALARQTLGEILKRLREAEKRRTSVLSDAEVKLEQRIEAWAKRSLASLKSADEANLYFGHLAARANLALVQMRRLLGLPSEPKRRASGAIGSNEPEVVFVPPSQREALQALEKRFLDSGERLADELAAYRQRGRMLDLHFTLGDEGEALEEGLLPGHLANWDFATPGTVATDLADYLEMGTSPHFSDVPRFAVRPTPVRRNPALLARSQGYFARGMKEMPLDWEGDSATQHLAELYVVKGDGLALRGQREEAVAVWQAFLDKYPKAELFPVVAQRIETLLMVSEEVEQHRRALASCALLEEPTLVRHATRTLRGEGQKGLLALVTVLEGCGKRAPEWRPWVYKAPALGALALGDCEAYAAVRARARERSAPFAEPEHRCDEP